MTKKLEIKPIEGTVGIRNEGIDIPEWQWAIFSIGITVAVWLALFTYLGIL